MMKRTKCLYHDDEDVSRLLIKIHQKYIDDAVLTAYPDESNLLTDEIATNENLHLVLH